KAQHFRRRKSRIEIQIYERYVHFRPVVVLAEGRTPVGVPEVFLRLVVTVAQSIEGLVSLWFFQVRRRGRHAVNGIDFGAQLPVLLGNDPVFRPGLRNTDGLGNPFEQLYNRSTAELKRIGEHVLIESAEPVVVGWLKGEL